MHEQHTKVVVCYNWSEGDVNDLPNVPLPAYYGKCVNVPTQIVSAIAKNFMEYSGIEMYQET